MPYRPIDSDIRAKVIAAVDAAAEAGEISRSAIVEEFAATGVAKSTLFRWVGRRSEELAVRIALRRQVGKPISETVGNGAQRVARAAAQISQREADYIDIVRGNIQELHAGLALAKAEDGRLRNPKLMLACVEGLGKQADRAFRYQHAAKIEQFMDDLIEMAMSEMPQKRGAIIKRIEDLGLRYSGVIDGVVDQ